MINSCSGVRVYEKSNTRGLYLQSSNTKEYFDPFTSEQVAKSKELVCENNINQRK